MGYYVHDMSIFNAILTEESIFIYPADQRVSKDAVLHQLCRAVAENLGEYDRDNPVKLVVLLAGGRDQHLKILSELAAVLQPD